MNRWQIHGVAQTRGGAQETLAAYSHSFGWREGLRLPDESRLVHMVADQALRAAGLAQRGLGNQVGVVLTSPTGGLMSYERVQNSLSASQAIQPTVFSPGQTGIPASVLSLYYGITGPVLHLSVKGGAEAALVALGLLESGFCQQVLTGSWRYPSATALACGEPAEAHVAIAVIGAMTPGATGRVLYRDAASAGARASDEDWHAALADEPVSPPRHLTTPTGTLVFCSAGDQT